MANENDLAKRTLTLKRTFDAPIDLVWEAWTKAEHIAQWWAPKMMKLTVVEHNFKVGGSWKYVMSMPDGTEFVSDGVYSEIIPMKKIVTTSNIKPMTEGTVISALFEAQGDKTMFTFSVLHPTEEYKLAQEKMGFYNGWGTVFDRLNDFVKSQH
jgi:uncharacterized protein YndB with AHSA1/START domain